jgi:hypothetical protein
VKEQNMKRHRLLAMLGVCVAAMPLTAPAQEVIYLPPGATVTGFAGPTVVGPPLVVGPPATTVQLPTFNFFTISTTVMVPDRGGTYLGGVGRAGSASGQNGAFGLGNRSGGSTVGGSGMSVGVQIHDLAAMDKALLDEARAARETSEANKVWATRIEQAKQSSAGRPTISVAEARRQRDAAPAEKR